MGLLVSVSFSGQGVLLQGVNDVLRATFGLGALFLPFLFFSAGLVLTGAKWSFAKPQVFLSAMLFLISSTVLGRFGTLGDAMYINFSSLIQPAGSIVLFGSLLIAAFMMITDTSLKEIGAFLASMVVIDSTIKKETKEQKEGKQSKGLFGLGGANHDEPEYEIKGVEDSEQEESDQALETQYEIPKLGARVSSKKAKASARLHTLDDDLEGVMKTDPSQVRVWQLPPVSILDTRPKGQADRGDININAKTIEKTLDSFGIQAKVKEINKGPSVTQYAIAMPEGKKLSKVVALSNDLALALAAPTGQIRIEAPIPGKSLVGIEIPNRSPSLVTLHSILSSEEMAKVPSKLAIAMGLNVSGRPVVGDITKMPHLLIAGSTGSGKSVAINAFLATILFRASPNEVRFIMVDPKRVELTPYNGIPHLLTPVIVEPKQVVSALKWATHEMERRYKLFAEVGARNIEGYNEMSGFQALPYILIVIDELADIMLFSPTEVEESITRIAQMARATGIHLVLATQRPSVDVITGLIKANIPARISFNVASMTDSRVILDTPGAEKLLGRGDMLFIPPDQAKPQRIQGTFIAETEMRQMIEYLRSQSDQPEYMEEITTKFQSTKVSGGGGSGDADLNDPDFLDAVQFLSENEKGASTSMLQRRFRWGFSKAGRIMDQLYEMGLVGEQSGSKPREIQKQAVQSFLEERNEQS